MPEQAESLLDTALAYVRAGLCVLPADLKGKRPVVPSWKPYQGRLPTEEELRGWFAGGAKALCVITGAVSGDLELVDFDAGGQAYEPWAGLVEERCPDLVRRLVREQSQSGGRHVCYRCEEPVPGNQCLARRRLGDKTVTLIETRGQGGLFLCAPSPGYVLEQGAFTDPPVLTTQERVILIEFARALNEVPDHPQPATAHASASFDDARPGDDYNARGDVREVLKTHGWTLVQTGENERWRRPGKEDGSSATFNGKVFYCFSSNAPPFEMNRGYSPFAAYALLEHGGDFAAAASALARQGYGDDVDNSEGVDLSLMLGPAPEDDRPEHPDPGPMPDHLLRVPGFIEQVVDYTLGTAPYPNPVLAFSGALCLQAFLSGRKVRDPGDNRTNLYLLGLANSGAGKEHPRKVNQKVLLEIGLEDCLGDSFASGEGIEDRLFAQPSMLFQTDEIDKVMVAIREGKEQRFESIMQMLLKMFTSSNGLYPMRVKAGKEHKVIDQPSLCIFGTAIPKHYYEALSVQMLTNGFFARMLILETGKRAEGQEPVAGDPPASVIETAKWWSEFMPGTGNLERWHPVPRVVDYTPEARDVLSELRQQADREYSSAEDNEDPVGMAIWARANEKARRLALIYACSENHEDPLINAEAARWAWELVTHQTRRMLFMTDEHVSENRFHAMCQKLVGVLRKWKAKKGGAWMPFWKLNRQVPWSMHDHEEVREALLNQRIIEYEEKRTGGTPQRRYRLR